MRFTPPVWMTMAAFSGFPAAESSTGLPRNTGGPRMARIQGSHMYTSGTTKRGAGLARLM